MIKNHITTYRCPITLTNKAKEKIRELGLDERSFFLLEKSFQVYIEKYPTGGRSNSFGCGVF